MTIFPVGATTYSPKLLQSSLVRRQISQYGADDIGITIFEPVVNQAPMPRDPDDGTLALELRFLPAGAMPDIEDQIDPRGPIMLEVTQDEMVREGQGVWAYRIPPERTGELGHVTASWTYKIDGKIFTYVDHLQIMEQMPLFQALSDMEKFAVTQVNWMFGDLFDSTEGGPHLTEQFQTHFTQERIAELMLKAIQKFNFMGQPASNYSLSCFGAGFPPSGIGVLVEGTYIEVLRHLCRSYVEIPDFTSMSVTYTQRRDYLTRWQSILKDEEQDYKNMVTTLKRQLMNLGSGSLLVAGGIYGGGGRSLYRPGMQTSLERSWRMYPASFAVAYPGVSR